MEVARHEAENRGLLLATGPLTAFLLTEDALAQQSASKDSMKYQDKPNGDKRWSNCARFVARMAARSSQESSHSTTSPARVLCG
jgi:hypothetical protein